MKLVLTHSALKDLNRLREFIAIKNPQAASRIGQRLKNAIQRLTDQPEMGANVEELPGAQDLISGNYIVRYTTLGDEIYILRVWHGKEDR